MYNNLIINNIQEAFWPEDKTKLNGAAPKKTGNPQKEPELFGSGDTSKVENAYKTYFRKYIDGEVTIGGKPSRKTNITLIGPAPGTPIDEQEKAELIYKEAEAILGAYIKEIFGEEQTHFKEVSKRVSDVKDLVKSKNLLQKVYDNISKKLSKSQQTKVDKQASSIVHTEPSHRGEYTHSTETEKVPAPGDLYDQEGAIDQDVTKVSKLGKAVKNINAPLADAENANRAKVAEDNRPTNPYVIYNNKSSTGFSRVVVRADGTAITQDVPQAEYYATSHIGVPTLDDNRLNEEQERISVQIENLTAEIAAKSRENDAISKIVDPKIDQYVLRVLNVSNDGTSSWPNAQRRPPQANPASSPLSLYNQAIKSKNLGEVKSNFMALEQNVAPIFADYFGLSELHLEGIVDQTTSEPKFPQIQLMNLIISRVIQKIHSEAKKSDLIKRELSLISAGESTKINDPAAFYTTPGGEYKERLNRTLKSISENEVIAFQKLFAENKYAAIGQAFSNAERLMYSTIQKNVNAINVFLNQNKGSVLAYAKSLQEKIIRYSQAAPVNQYETEYEDIGLTDAFESQSSLIGKKWRERFSKIPAEAKPFSEISAFIKLVDSKFSNQEAIDQENFKVTAQEMSSTFFNPVLFFLSLLDNPNVLKNDQIDATELVRSDWGKNLRDYMGAQKISYSTPREDLAVLLDINKFMRDGLSKVTVDNPSSELGQRLQQAGESQPSPVKNTAGLQLMSGDRDVLVNTRDFINKLKTELPTSYSALIFSELGRLRKEILAKKASKEFEAAAQIFNGPYSKAKEDVIAILSPILREFLFERYAQDTRLIETEHLFYAMLREFNKLVENYDPDSGQDIETYLLSGLKDFNRSKVVRAMHGGSDRLWYIPQDNESIMDIIHAILDAAEIKEMHKKESFHSVREIALKPPEPEFNSNSASLVKKRYLEKQAYEAEKARSIKRVDKRTGREIYEVLDVADKDVTYYTIEPKESIVRDPEQAAQLIAKLWSSLEKVFWKKLERIGFSPKVVSSLEGEDKMSTPSDEIHSRASAFYFHQIETALGSKTAGGKGKKGKKVLEPIASDDKDKQNQHRAIPAQEAQLVEKDNQIMELLSMAGLLFDSINIDETEFMSRVGQNIFAQLDTSANITGLIKSIVASMFRKDWGTVHSLLFKPIGKDAKSEGPWINAKQISPEERADVKPPLMVVLGTILATCIDLIHTSAQAFKEGQGKKLSQSGIFEKLGVEELYSGYSRVLDSLKELLNCAFLHRIGQVQPMRGIPKGRGVTAKGRWGVIGFNADQTTSIRHPFTVRGKWAKMAKGLGHEFAQNQDPTSDTRQQAMLAAQNAQNRFMYKLQQHYKGEGDPVNTTNVLRTLGNSIEGEIGGAFKDLYRSRRFAGSSWKNRDLDQYHYKIIKQLKSDIEQLGYRPDRPEWFVQNENLQARAVDIVSEDIKKQFLQGIETGKTLAGPGEKEDATSGVTGPSNPLHRSGKNPSSRLLGDVAPDSKLNPKHDIASNQFDYEAPVELDIDPGFAGNTAVDKLTADQKKADAEKRLQQFIELYPQFLEEKAMINVSMFEPKTENQTLEETLEGAAASDDVNTLNVAVHEFDNVLDDCFARISQKVDKYNDNKFIKSYKNLDETETKLINQDLDNLDWQITQTPLESKRHFKAALSLRPDSDRERDKAFRDILFMKYFEYVYIREVLLSETIMYLMNIENSRKGPSEKKIESIAEYIQQSNLNIRHIPGVEYKFYRTDDVAHRIKMSDMLKAIFGDVEKVPQFLAIAEDIKEYIGGATDQAGDTKEDKADKDSAQTYGMSSKSTAQTDVHGVEATKQGKQEKTRVSAIDKQMFNTLNIQNVSKIMSKVLMSDAEPNYEGDVSYDKVRSYIRSLVQTYNEPITTNSATDRIVWFISHIKDNVIRIRNFLQSAANAQALVKMSPFDRKEIFGAIDNVLRFSTYQARNVLNLKKSVYKLIQLMYNAPIGEEVDYDTFDVSSASDKLKEVTKAVQIATKTPYESFVPPYTKELATSLQSFGKMIQSGAIEAPDKTAAYLTDKGGLILTIMSYLKTNGKKPVDVSVFDNLSNSLDQLLDQIKTLAKLNAEPKARYKDPNAGKVLPQDKATSASSGKLGRATPNQNISPEDQEIVKKLQAKKSVTKESRDFEPFKEAIAVEKILKCIKMQSGGIQRVRYSEYSKANPGKLSRVLYELSKQTPIDLDNYRVFLTEENKSKVNIVFEYKNENRGLSPEYIWIVPKSSNSSN